MDTNPESGLNAALAAELRAERAAADMNVDELAASSGLSKSTVLRYLNAKRVIPIDALEAMGRALAVTSRELIERAESRRDRKESAAVGGSSDAEVLDLATRRLSRAQSSEVETKGAAFSDNVEPAKQPEEGPDNDDGTQETGR